MNSQLTESNIVLRPVGPGDHEFLLGVYATTRTEEMAVVPWTDEQREAFVRSQFLAQQDYYGKKYQTANHDIILTSDRRVGHLYVARLGGEIRIVDLTLLPTERNRGIGSYLIRQLLVEAQQEEKKTRIYVEEFNPSLRLFERFGFRTSEQQGIHLLLEWTPAANTEPCV